MSPEPPDDHYETLQISPNADVDTIQRVFRLLAQRFHPDNQDTGNAAKFRELHDAYSVLSDPESRARYDVRHQALRQERWRFAATGPASGTNFETEQQLRCILLEILYSRRRTDPEHPSLSNSDLSQLMGHPREHLEFTIWYLSQKKFVTRDDRSSLTITADGVDYVEHNHGSG
ncbi:MAG: J domain-containing protein, partial [Vicinamibacterales bacterium]